MIGGIWSSSVTGVGIRFDAGSAVVDCSVRLCAQAVSSTASANAGDGVIHPGVCRGLVLSERGDGVELSLGCVARGLKIAAGTEVGRFVGVVVPAICQGSWGCRSNLHTGVLTGEADVLGHLFALVPRDGAAQAGPAGSRCACHGLAYRLGAVAVGELEQVRRSGCGARRGCRWTSSSCRRSRRPPSGPARPGPSKDRSKLGALSSRRALPLTVGDELAHDAFCQPSCLARRFTGCQPHACPRSSGALAR